MNSKTNDSNLIRITRRLLQGLTVLAAFAAMRAPADTILSQNFSSDPENYTLPGNSSPFRFEGSPPRYWAVSNTPSLTVNATITGADGNYLGAQNLDSFAANNFSSGAPAQIDFTVAVAAFSNLNLSIALAGIPTAETVNFVRAKLDNDGDGTYETTLFEFKGNNNSAYTDTTPGLNLGVLTSAFQTFPTIPLPAPTAVDGMLRLRLESFNDTDSANEATGIDSILITGTPTGGNIPPVVAVTSPANNATVGANFTIEATATDADGIANVKFYDGVTLLDTDTTFPYSYDVVGAAQGNHLLKAVAEDTLGVTTHSAVVTVNFPLPPIAVGVSGSGVLSFDSLPPSTQWTTLSVAGGSGDVSDSGTMDSAMAVIAASSISTVMASQADNTTRQVAFWRSDLGKLETYSAGSNKMALLMAKLENTSGSSIDKMDVAYKLGVLSSTPAEQINGHRVYWSKTGATSSWTAAGNFEQTAIGTSDVSLELNMSGDPWLNGELLYVVWVDDNATNTEGDFTIDDVSFTKATPQAKMLTFGPGATIGALSSNAAAVTWYVQGTSAESLSPTFTLSDGATCTVAGNPAVSGETRDYTNPVEYTVTSSDSAITNVYTVTVILVPVETTITWNLPGGGAWNTSSLNWLGQISNLPTTFADGTNVIFNNSAGGTITVAPNVAPLSMAVSGSGNYSFTGGPISGSGALTKAGASTLTMAGLNSFTGKTTVQAGTLTLSTASIGFTNEGVAGPLGAPTGADAVIDLFNGVTVRSGNTSPRVDQVTNRPLNLAATGPGTVTLRVNDNDTNFTFGAVTATGTGAKTIALVTGADGNGDREAVIFNGSISDSSDSSSTSLNVNYNTQTGSESYVSLNGGGTFTGPITLVRGSNANSAFLVVGGVRTRSTNVPGSGSLGGGSYSGNVSLDTNTIFYYNSSANQVLSGDISGPGALTKVVAASTLTLSGSNSYGGITTVTAGTLRIDGANSGTGAVNVSSGATLGGTGSVGGNVTYSAGALALFTHGSPMTIAGTLTLNTNVVHLALPTNLTNGTYTLATYTDAGSSGTFAITPVIDSGSLAPGGTATVDTSAGVVSLTVVGAAASDYDTWAAGYLPNDVSIPGLDFDGDGLINQHEYAFGLNPTSGSLVSPITQQLDKGTGIFKYTRRATPATTGLSYIYEWSTSLVGIWGTFTPVIDPPATNGGSPVEEITIQVPAAQLANPTLFVRVRAE